MEVLASEQLNKVPILIFANKQDEELALGAEEVSKQESKKLRPGRSIVFQNQFLRGIPVTTSFSLHTDLSCPGVEQHHGPKLEHPGVLGPLRRGTARGHGVARQFRPNQG